MGCGYSSVAPATQGYSPSGGLATIRNGPSSESNAEGTDFEDWKLQERLGSITVASVAYFSLLRYMLLKAASARHCEESVLAVVDFTRYGILVKAYSRENEGEVNTGSGNGAGTMHKLALVRQSSRYLVHQYLKRGASLQVNVSEYAREHTTAAYSRLVELLRASMTVARPSSDLVATISSTTSPRAQETGTSGTSSISTDGTPPSVAPKVAVHALLKVGARPEQSATASPSSRKLRAFTHLSGTKPGHVASLGDNELFQVAPAVFWVAKDEELHVKSGTVQLEGKCAGWAALCGKGAWNSVRSGEEEGGPSKGSRTIGSGGSERSSRSKDSQNDSGDGSRVDTGRAADSPRSRPKGREQKVISTSTGEAGNSAPLLAYYVAGGSESGQMVNGPASGSSYEGPFLPATQSQLHEGGTGGHTVSSSSLRSRQKQELHLRHHDVKKSDGSVVAKALSSGDGMAQGAEGAKGEDLKRHRNHGEETDSESGNRVGSDEASQGGYSPGESTGTSSEGSNDDDMPQEKSERPSARGAKYDKPSILTTAMESIAHGDLLAMSASKQSRSTDSGLIGTAKSWQHSAGMHSMEDLHGAKVAVLLNALHSQVEACANLASKLQASKLKHRLSIREDRTKGLRGSTASRRMVVTDTGALEGEEGSTSHPSDEHIGPGGYLLPSAFRRVHEAAERVILNNVWEAFLSQLERALSGDVSQLYDTSMGPGKIKDTAVGPSAGSATSFTTTPSDKAGSQISGVSGGKYAVQLIQRQLEQPKRKVVIVGATACGCIVANALSKDPRFHVTLVAGQRQAMDWHLPPLHGIVPNTRRKSHFWKHQKPLHIASTLQNGQVVNEECLAIHADAVEAGRSRLPYDYLVMSPGKTPTVPPAQAATRNWFSLACQGTDREKLGKAILKSKSLLVVGGGAGGVELAIAYKRAFPRRNCTLVSRSKVLLPRYTASASRISRLTKEPLDMRVDLTAGDKTEAAQGKGPACDRSKAGLYQEYRPNATNDCRRSGPQTSKTFPALDRASLIQLAAASQDFPYSHEPRRMFEEIFLMGGVIPCKVISKVSGGATDLTDKASTAAGSGGGGGLHQAHTPSYLVSGDFEDSRGTGDFFESSLDGSMEFGKSTISGQQYSRRPPIDPSKHALDALTRHGVVTVLGDPIASWKPNEGGGRTHSGRVLPADTIVWAERGKADNYYAALHLQSRMDASGSFLVEYTMRVVGTRRVFAGGPCVAVRKTGSESAGAERGEYEGKVAQAASGAGADSGATTGNLAASCCHGEEAVQLGLAHTRNGQVIESDDVIDPYVDAISDDMIALVRGMPMGLPRLLAAVRYARVKLASRGTVRGFVKEEEVLAHEVEHALAIIYNIQRASTGAVPLCRPPLAGFGPPQVSVDLGDSGIRMAHGCGLSAFDVAAYRMNLAAAYLEAMTSAKRPGATAMSVFSGEDQGGQVTVSERSGSSCSQASALGGSGFLRRIPRPGPLLATKESPSAAGGGEKRAPAKFSGVGVKRAKGTFTTGQSALRVRIQTDEG